MSRYLGPLCKVSRRFGLDLESKSRDIKTKCNFNTPPGQHASKNTKQSDFGKQLHAKQALKYKYGLTEKQFYRFYNLAVKQPGPTGEALIKLLESRLDNLVFRSGFAATRKEARQMVSHKHVMVDDHLCNIPSFLVQEGQKISLVERAAKHIRVLNAVNNSSQDLEVDWLEVSETTKESVFKRYPDRDELSTDINENLVVELYSK